jgi:aminomethyltransferase
LQHHLAGEEIKIEDLFTDYIILSVQGPHAERFITEAASMTERSSKDLVHLQGTIADSTVVLIVVTHGAELGYDLVIPIPKLPTVVSHIEEVGKRWSLSLIGIEAQEILRIEAGIPVYGADITETTLLFETGQDQWVSFGRRLAGLNLESKLPVQTGAKIYDGEREIGSVTSCRFSPSTGSAVALGYVRRDYAMPKTRVIIRDGEKSLMAVVSPLPIQ